MIAHYWWVGLSVLYTLGGLVWTIRAERRLRALRRETTNLWKSISAQGGRIFDLENYLERTPTSYFRKAPRLTILPVPPPKVAERTTFIVAKFDDANDPSKKEA